MHANHSLGKKLRFEVSADGQVRAAPTDGDLRSTLEKLMLLHDAGACPTEIVGLAATGDFLIVKQPLCMPHLHLADDRKAAAEAMGAVVPKTSIGREIRVFSLAGEAWALGDLHEGNIMRTFEGNPTIIDALVCPIPPKIVAIVPHLARAISRAEAVRAGVGVEEVDPFFRVDDADL